MPAGACYALERMRKPAVVALLVAATLQAHHSFSAEFDPEKQVTFQGVVTKIEWTNPHIYFYADVKDPKGKQDTWVFETAGPNTLVRLGWSRNSLKVGDRVTVIAFPARDGAKVASAREVVLANGKKVFSGSPNDGGPAAKWE